VIATKGGLRSTDAGLVRDASPQWLRRDVDASLSALGIDQIDLYQVHWPDPMVPPSETAGVMADLLAEGKIRHVGVSNYDRAQVEEFSATLPVETVQPPYSMFRRNIEDELLAYCRAQNIGVFVYGPLAHGLLTGTVDRDTSFDAEDWRGKSDIFRGDGFKRNLEVIAQLKRLAADLDVTISQLALAWTLAQPGVHAAIVGAQHLGYLQDSAGAAEITLAEADLATIEEILESAAPVGGPYPEMSRQVS
jgi:aryl-alcohol dehydrogenase-like predicted oxidoreductase